MHVHMYTHLILHCYLWHRNAHKNRILILTYMHTRTHACTGRFFGYRHTHMHTRVHTHTHTHTYHTHTHTYTHTHTRTHIHAHTHHQEAIRLDAGNPLAKLRKAMALSHLERNSEALEELQQLQQLAPREYIVFMYVCMCVCI